MIKVLMSLVFSVFFLTGFGFAQTPPQGAVPATSAPKVMKPMHRKHKEHNPQIRKALRKLRGAKYDLEKAASDFGGHKVKAIEAIDRAMAELRDALNFDKK